MAYVLVRAKGNDDDGDDDEVSLVFILLLEPSLSFCLCDYDCGEWLVRRYIYMCSYHLFVFESGVNGWVCCVFASVNNMCC